jgi:hypothetical protein
MVALNAVFHVSPLTTMLEAYVRAGFALVPIIQGKGANDNRMEQARELHHKTRTD